MGTILSIGRDDLLRACHFPILQIFDEEQNARSHRGLYPTRVMRSQTIAFWLSLLALTKFSSTAAADTIIGIASVIDGDTIEIHGERIRLLDMDAPETPQMCQDAGGADYRCGQRAALALSDYLGQHTVTCDWSKLDRYGREFAVCWLGSEDVNGWLVA